MKWNRKWKQSKLLARNFIPEDSTEPRNIAFSAQISRLILWKDAPIGDYHWSKICRRIYNTTQNIWS